MLDPMTGRVVSDRPELGVELTLSIEAATPIEHARLAANADLEVMRTCDGGNTHAGCETLAEHACETLTE